MIPRHGLDWPQGPPEGIRTLRWGGSDRAGVGVGAMSQLVAPPRRFTSLSCFSLTCDEKAPRRRIELYGT
jgi:hypothetical protein